MHNRPQTTTVRWRRRGVRLSALTCTLATAVALAACGSSSSSSSTSTASASGSSGSSASSDSGVTQAKAELQKYQATPAKITISTPLKSAPPAGKTVVMLGTSDPSNAIIQRGVQKLAGMVHWNYSLVTYDPANPATFNQAIDTALSKHANYLFEAGLPLTPAQEQKVQAAGAKWVLSAVYPVTVKSPVLGDSADCADDQLQGQLIADFMVADSGGKANAVIEHIPAYPILGCFTDAFTKTVKSLCSSCTTKMVNITIPDLAAGRVPANLVSALRSNPDANYLVFDDGPFATGVLSALKAAGLDGKVKLIGEAADQAGVAALKNGTNTAWTGYDPGYLSYTMLDAALRDAEGMPISQADEGKTPLQVLTKSNVGSTTAWSEPQDAQAQFQALWKVS